MEQPAYVHIMASRRNGTLYTGSTPDLPRRAWEHRNLVVAGFTKRYRCILLVWYEQHPELASARGRERQLKEWRREWKLELIEWLNPEWTDLYERIVHD
ncbi:GIY-YIG nuclease family protein [Sphingomonas sp.]|jgi:putative endonuclease|uniref:GIY-YIG nuclease family protein n=1 Tax=Sphingomonas sp. TaxID=28214 RepID=UPI002D80489E|nr:GIY-YIG nuclease family protein [Sphingomonas sp.]HEU0045336.1 GIY-YIG nuclease family protein [Sphingomonas sp.]